MKLKIVAALAIVLTACGGDTAQPVASKSPVKSETGTPAPAEESEGTIFAQGGEIRLIVQSLDGRRSPGYVVRNETEAEIGYGYPYVLSTYVDESWQEITNDPKCVFQLPLLLLQPGKRTEVMPIGRCDEQGETELLPPGSYRIRKQVELADGSRLPIAATFRVRSPGADSP